MGSLWNLPIFCAKPMFLPLLYTVYEHLTNSRAPSVGDGTPIDSILMNCFLNRIYFLEVGYKTSPFLSWYNRHGSTVRSVINFHLSVF